METYFVIGTYGGSKTPSSIYVAEDRSGGRWYVAEDSVNVNFTYDSIQDGVDIELLEDHDFFTAGKPITSEDELEEAINS